MWQIILLILCCICCICGGGGGGAYYALNMNKKGKKGNKQSARRYDYDNEAPRPEEVPLASVGVDLNGDGRVDAYVTGVDQNRDGIPDALEGDNNAPMSVELVQQPEVPMVEPFEVVVPNLFGPLNPLFPGM